MTSRVSIKAEIPARNREGDLPHFSDEHKSVAIETTTYDWLVKITHDGNEFYVALNEIRDALTRFKV